MAQYYHLNIYKTTYEFMVYYSRIFVHFQREYKFTIGEKLLDKIMQFTILIYKSNSAKSNFERAEFLKNMCGTLCNILKFH